MRKKSVKVDAKTKFRILMGIMIPVLVIFGIGAWASFASIDMISFGEIFGVVSALILVFAAIYHVWDRKRDVDAGLPFEDEFSKKMMHKAGYYAFFASMYSGLAISMFEDTVARLIGVPELEVSTVVGMTILISSMVFFISIFRSKMEGDV